MVCGTGSNWTRSRWQPVHARARDFSRGRLVHYTGTNWRHVQPWILLTNSHRTLTSCVRHGLDMLQAERFTLQAHDHGPGNVVIDAG